MDVRPGYKQTEVGVIPEDWDIVNLGDLINYTKGYAFKSSEYVDDGVRVIRVSDTTYDAITDDGAVFVSERSARSYARWCLRESDLVFSTVGSKPPMYDSLVGKVILVPREYSGSLLNQNAVVVRAKKYSEGFQKLLLNHFRTDRYIRYIETIFRGNANQASITLADLFGYQFPLPSTKAEQEAIADALGDADALIESLEQLLAKKRQIKQGAMQELLTGKKRLPGFSGEWDLHALGNIATATKGSQLSSSQTSDHGTFAHLNGGMFPSGYTGQSNAPGDTIAVSEGGNSCGYVQFMSAPYWCGGHCYSVVPTGVDNRFLYHALKGEEPFIMGLRVGSGLPNVQKTALLAFELHVPKARHEQTAIAAILSDMDAEIAALEAKFAKARSLKQGMMQELLTGRIRLV